MKREAFEMENFVAAFDFESVLEELNKSNEGKDISLVSQNMSEEMEASRRRVEEYILKNKGE